MILYIYFFLWAQKKYPNLFCKLEFIHDIYQYINYIIFKKKKKVKQGKSINFHNFHLSLFLQCILSLKQTILEKNMVTFTRSGQLKGHLYEQ